MRPGTSPPHPALDTGLGPAPPALCSARARGRLRSWPARPRGTPLPALGRARSVAGPGDRTGYSCLDPPQPLVDHLRRRRNDRESPSDAQCLRLAVSPRLRSWIAADPRRDRCRPAAGVAPATGQAPDPALLGEEAAQDVKIGGVHAFPGELSASSRGTGALSGAHGAAGCMVGEAVGCAHAGQDSATGRNAIIVTPRRRPTRSNAPGAQNRPNVQLVVAGVKCHSGQSCSVRGICT